MSKPKTVGPRACKRCPPESPLHGIEQPESAFPRGGFICQSCILDGEAVRRARRGPPKRKSVPKKRVPKGQLVLDRTNSQHRAEVRRARPRWELRLAEYQQALRQLDDPFVPPWEYVKVSMTPRYTGHYGPHTEREIIQSHIDFLTRRLEETADWDLRTLAEIEDKDEPHGRHERLLTAVHGAEMAALDARQEERRSEPVSPKPATFAGVRRNYTDAELDAMLKEPPGEIPLDPAFFPPYVETVYKPGGILSRDTVDTINRSAKLRALGLESTYAGIEELNDESEGW